MTDPIIDMNAIAKLRSDYGDEDGSFLASMAEAFSDEVRVFQEASRAPAAAGEGLRLSPAAHRLKSVAATVGATQVVRLCQKLEAAERGAESASTADVLGQLLPAIVRAKVALKRTVDAATNAKR